MTATRPALPAKVSPGRRAAKRREILVALAFVLPAAIGFGAFYVAPAVRGIYLSFTDYNLMSAPSFIGLDNYVRLASDPLFWNSVGVTLQYVAINIVVQTIVAVGLAVLMHRLTQSVVIRGTILLPFLISNVIAAMIWFLLLDYQLGFVNSVIEWLGLTRIPFFADSGWAIPTIALVNVWRHMGYTALLVFAGLQMIPPYVYEAAAIDGSSEWRSFWRITLPLLRPILALVLVITVTGSFQVFDTVAVTTRGGPVNATRVIQYYIYQVGFGENDFGYASAISVVLLLILACVAFFQLRLMRADQSDLA
ncbi:ABC transporter permease subunit [Rathayibacter sp. VKM Ac-2803]|uniref:carbohydrate ABC transporter permease n=1 Tax=unclassified Rathayibacter TaxID=2609250 RepID=UPI00135A40EB|nr:MULTISPECIES: sugar ABC transporter permease [unclassified Rathayibacter]MWV48646.1 ABC transporter permease subunit [Rathayibacter sp. VKM Ac-2803]MWV60675.1 ABC transporter permease subunit [Rathayibacter sp. VKM Ac-2754]